jgi:hypothetical protein
MLKLRPITFNSPTSEWTYENLRTHKVLDVSLPKVLFKFVHDSHPIIDVLRLNEEMIGVNVDLCPKVEGYFKITTSVIDVCCSVLERDALVCLAMQGICLNPSSQRLGDNDDLLKMIFNYSMESALWREYLMAQTPPVALH